MIKERRAAYHRQPINQSIHIQQDPISQHYHQLAKDSIHQQLLTRQQKNNAQIRGGLVDLINYSNAPLGLDASSMFIKPSSFMVQDYKYQRGSKCKGKENIYHKIAELIRNEEVGTPTCHSSRSKQMKRPLTSVSNHTRKSIDQSVCQKGNFVLHIKPGELDEQTADCERVSTSRALMNFSKVYKNASNERFKVKKNKSLMPRFAQLSAQKIVFQEKIKKQRTQLKGQPSLGNSLNHRRKSTQVNRYAEPQQQFEIGGWDYFE